MSEPYALLFDVVPSSFFSIRQPHSFQSAIAYPLPPPSTLKGLMANAMLQNSKTTPLKALEEIESKIFLCTALSRHPLSLSSATIRLRVFDKGKWSKDALPRQFAFTHRISCAALSNDGDYINRLSGALKSSILYLGDSESLLTMLESKAVPVEAEKLKQGSEIEINSYAPAELFEEIYGEATLYWVFENASEHKTQRRYVFPLKNRGNILYPLTLRGKLKKDAILFKVADMSILAEEK
jgi:CRISPR-associated Cas5-like protein